MPENVPVLTTPALPVNTYTSIPTSISAIQWTGENLDDVKAWVGDDNLDHWVSGVALTLWVEANTAWLPLEAGEWIIKDDLGFYPCKDSVFARKYRQDPVIPADADVQRLCASTDAMVWAEEFVKMNPQVDEGTMLGWFANAMQTAIDLTKRKLDHDLIISADMRRHLERMFDGPIEVKPRSLDMTTVDVNPFDITADGGSRTPGIEVRNIVLVTKAVD